MGTQGSGKTLYLVKTAYEYHKKGFKVYSNFKLNFPHEILSFKDIMECKLSKCVVSLDEASLWGLNSRESMSKKNNKITSQFIVQLRKQDVHLFASAQLLRQLDVRVRENADYICEAKKFAIINGVLDDSAQAMNYPKKIPIIIEVNVVRCYDSREAKIRFHANPLFSLYDTNEVIKLIGDA